MNSYGKLALSMWQQLAPTALSQIEDPNQHFSELGEEALEQVTDLTLRLQGDDPAGETYMQKVGRIESAKLRAEEIVRADLLVPPPEVQDLTDEEIEDELLPKSGAWEILSELHDLDQERRRIETEGQ